jgi:hypothetical protein
VTAEGGGIRARARAVEEWFLGTADPRAYAGLRIGYAFAAAFVFVDLWRFRRELFSRSGVLGGAVREHALGPNLFAFIESDLGVDVFLVVALAAIVCLALGVRPRLSALVVYVWTVSYSATVPEALGGFDTILRVVGFILVISPQVDVWSVGKQTSARPPAYGLRLVQCQLAIIYGCTVWLKAPDPFWRSGDAVPYFLMSMFARQPGAPWYDAPLLGNLLTYSTLIVEASLPLLLWARRTRGLGLLLGSALHVGIALGARLTAFTLCMLPLYVAFLETHDFDRLYAFAARLRRGRPLGLAR